MCACRVFLCVRMCIHTRGPARGLRKEEEAESRWRRWAVGSLGVGCSLFTATRWTPRAASRLLRWFAHSLSRSLVGMIVRPFLLFFLRAHVVFPRSFRPGWYSPRYTGGYSFRSCAHADIPHRQKQRYSSPPPFQHRSASSSSLPCVRYHSPPSPSLTPHPPHARLPFACDELLSRPPYHAFSLSNRCCVFFHTFLYPFILRFHPLKHPTFFLFLSS